MPSKKGFDQAMLWLRSKAAGDDLDAINAEVCINVINDLKEQNTRKGALIHRLKGITEERGFLREDFSLYRSLDYQDGYNDRFSKTP